MGFLIKFRIIKIPNLSSGILLNIPDGKQSVYIFSLGGDQASKNQPETNYILFYYMALSRKDWELTNAWIWLAEMDIDRGLDFPM